MKSVSAGEKKKRKKEKRAIKGWVTLTIERVFLTIKTVKGKIASDLLDESHF